jgi:diacylglycerol O-acyltransferase / wax synthase
MRPMPITDAIFLMGEVREKPLHVGGLQLFRPPEGAGPGDVQKRFREAIGNDEVATLFRRHPRRIAGFGPWEWSEDEQLDLEYHVRHSALPHPGKIRELLALVSRLHGTLLDRNRPLWEIHLIEGLADGRVAMYSKVHHSLLDGVSAMRWMERSLSPDADERGMPPPWAPRGVRSPSLPSGTPLDKARGLARDAVEGGRAVGEASLAAVRTLGRALEDRAASLPYQAPRSMLNVPITGARRFAAQSWDMARIHDVADTHGGSVNDVVLAMSSGALRRYLLDHDALPEQPLVSAVPVSLRGSDDDGNPGAGGNAVGVVLCNLGTHLADPADRFELIHRSMRDSKAQLSGLGPLAIMMLSAINFGPIALAPLYRYELLRKPAFNVIISNVPGPKEPLYWNGARLEGSYPVSIPYDGQALNITVASYAGSLEFGLIGCRRRVPRLQRLLTHLEDSLAELEEAA